MKNIIRNTKTKNELSLVKNAKDKKARQFFFVFDFLLVSFKQCAEKHKAERSRV